MLSRCLGKEMVELHVGEGETQQHFHVHKNALCTRIQYFDKMFNSGFKESVTSSATFPEDNPDHFDVLIEWVYTGALRHCLLRKNAEGDVFCSNWDMEGVYLLAEKFLLPKLMDQIMNAIRESSREFKQLHTIPEMARVYKLCTPGSPLRRYFSQMIAFLIVEPYTSEERFSIAVILRALADDAELNADVIVAISKGRGYIADPRIVPNCAFHYHGADEPCSFSTRLILEPFKGFLDEWRHGLKTYGETDDIWSMCANV